MSERLPPIPTPRAHLWKTLRLQYLPLVVFLIGLIAAFQLWTRWVAPPTLVGEAEAIRTELRSAQAGRLDGLTVQPMQVVKAGETLGHVHVNEPRVLEASLAVIRAELAVLQTSARLSIEQLRLDWMNKRVAYVALQGQLHQAEATLARTTAMHRQQLATDEQLDMAKNARDALTAQLKVQAELIARLEPEIREGERDARAFPLANEGLSATIRQKDEQLKLLAAQLAPRPLIAPIDGIVTFIWRRNGESVGTAEPILQITATHYERIVGFLRPPLAAEPKPGMTVEVRTRTFRRQAADATITQVGQQFEPITPTLLAALRLPVTAIPTELGLRVHVAPPPGLAIRPGEHVDLIIRE